MSKTQDAYKAISEKILEALDKEIIPWSCPWDKTMTDAPRNLNTNRYYHGCNVFLLYLETANRPEWEGCPYWLTFKQARALGGHVKKGEKGTKIYFWKVTTSENEDEEEGQTKRFWMQSFVVFNAMQTDGCKWPKGRYGAWKTPRTAPAPDPVDAAEAIVSGYPAPPEIVTGYDGRAYYRPSIDRVSMPPRETFRTAEGWYSTIFHELGHSTGHETRLARPEICGGDLSRINRAREELVAEMTAAFLCTRAGLELHIENTASYIDGWRREISADPSIVMTAASRAERAARHILRETREGETEEAAPTSRQLALV